MSLDRREFARLFALGGSAALLARPAYARFRPAPLADPPKAPDEAYWRQVRDQFLMPQGLSVLNAANLCPSSAPVLEALDSFTRRLDREPVPSVREQMHAVKETTRRELAAFLRVSAEEIVLVRNTSEANNLVSSGIDLRAGDEILILADNHVSNHRAWTEKAKRFGFTVKTLPQLAPHPGPGHYLEAFRSQLTSRTRLIAFTHLTSTVGDLFPAKELCALAQEHGVLSLVDGAQSLGLLDVDLGDMQPDFFTGSAHKWPCGPKEVGLLYVNKRSHGRIWPSIYSAYPGKVGLSTTFEGLGQRDEPAIHAFGEALRFQSKIGMKNIEARSRQLAQLLIAELRRIPGVKLWTSVDPALTAAVVSFQPATLDPARVLADLERDGIVGASRLGTDRPGIRFSPHFYNLPADIERATAAVRRYLAGA